MTMKKFLVTLAAILCLVVPAASLADVPASPMEAFFVNDFADVLDSDDVQYMNELGALLEDETSAQVVAVTITFLDGMDEEEYAYQIFDKWGIGDAEKNNGVLILLAVGDHGTYVMVGTGLEKKLPPSVTGAYQDEYAIPYWAEGDYSTGMRELYGALCEKVASIYGVTLQQETSYGANQVDTSTGSNNGYVYQENTSSGGGFGGIMSIIIGIIVLVVVFSIVGSLFRSAGNASGCLFGWLLGRGSSRPRRRSMWGAPPPPPPPMGGSRSRPRNTSGRSTGSFGGFGGFGGGSSSGRSSGGSFGRSSGSSGRSSGPRSGGGGKTRGGGSGRKF